MTARQTISFLRKRFEEAGFRPVTRYGQNFLIDLNLVRFLAQAAEVNSDNVVLEVGTGTGSLTGLVARHAAHVVTVEIDERLHLLASEELSEFDNVTMLRTDALKNKNRFNPQLLDALEQQLTSGRRLKLVANLPYNVATPIISNLLLTGFPIESMTVTIQKELADRIVAPPNCKDYGSLSVWLQSLCHCAILKVMPPTVFWPRPKVTSAIVQIKPSDELRGRFPDIPFLHRFARSVFLHRRKFLRSALLGGFKDLLDKPAVDRVMAEMELGPDARAEQLDLAQMHRLCELLRQRQESDGN